MAKRRKPAPRKRPPPASPARRSSSPASSSPTHSSPPPSAPAAPSAPSPPSARSAPSAPSPAAPSAPSAPSSPSPAPSAPAFWFGFEVSRAKLAIGRVLLFGILSLDSLLQLRHAPRYGAGDFNVAHLPFLDALGPTRWSFESAQLVVAYLLVLAAFGVATRLALPIATALYAWLYFGSQLDSYQHHYLVALVLLVACFIPWERPPDAGPRTRVRTWALRLLLVQLGIMYFWAAVSKMNGAWLDGSALSQQLHGPVRHLIAWKLPLVHVAVGMATASKLVLATELTLAVTIWIPRAWHIAAPLGILLHLGILASSLDIGLFAWIMLALYAFVVPDPVWIALAELAPIRALRTAIRDTRARLDAGARWLIGGLGTIAALVLAARCRLPHALAVAAVVLAVGGVAALATVLRHRQPRIAALGLASVLAVGAWLAVDRKTTVIVDYYRFWGGASRRLGDRTTSERAYRTLTEVAPDDGNGHFQLARLLLERGADDDALTQLHAAERLEPHRARAYLLDARWLAEHHRRGDAIAKAEAAVAAEPGDRTARRLLELLRRR